jgi:RNA polymerase sigma-70 factor (ECF subfamily)
VTSQQPGSALGQADERAVVALAISGDDAAFSELVRRRQSWLRNLLRRLCREGALADDLAQQVFLQAWRSLHKLRATGAFGAWLRRMAINSWLAHVRSSGNDVVVGDDDWVARGDEVVGTSDTDPHTVTSQHQLDLDRALARLSANERLCVVLGYSEGMSHGEIAETTGLPLGTVKSHIKRGSERLRVLLHSYGPTEADNVRRA